MSGQVRRIAVMFDLDGADYATREIVRGIHQYAHEQAGRWVPTLDPLAADHLDGRYDGMIGTASRPAAEQARDAQVAFVGVGCMAMVRRMPRVLEHRTRGGTMAARHLIACSYNRFAFLGYYYSQSSTLLEKRRKRFLTPFPS